MPIVYTHGVWPGTAHAGEFVAKCCTNPARLMGLYPKKGCHRRGGVPDLAIIDPAKQIKSITPKWKRTLTGALPGLVAGRFAETTFSRGGKIVADYKFVGEGEAGPLAVARAGRDAQVIHV